MKYNIIVCLMVRYCVSFYIIPLTPSYYIKGRKEEKMMLKCNKCGITNVKIYRPYGFCRDVESDRCNKCICKEDGYMIPTVLDSEGYAWGLFAIPQKEVDIYLSLPEADESGDIPKWGENGWCGYFE